MFPWRKSGGESRRRAAVAGTFYPAAPAALRRAIAGYLAEASARVPAAQTAPKALIVPHAGYIYSGPIAASAYNRLAAAGSAQQITRVVMLGPAHRVRVAGLAASSAESFATPLGDVPVDQEALASLGDLEQVTVLDEAHRNEHCLEVQLPFLQVALEGAFSIVPLLVGRASADQVREVLDRLWGGDETLIVVTSDLSHYHDYETARTLDSAAAAAIVALRPDDLGDDQACGRIPIRGLLSTALAHGLSAENVDLRSSGDTGGDRSRVVGYGAFVLGRPPG
jgi:AmmeMemoRadiSam system protein B